MVFFTKIIKISHNLHGSTKDTKNILRKMSGTGDHHVK
jgi:hypothetical protein